MERHNDHRHLTPPPAAVPKGKVRITPPKERRFSISGRRQKSGEASGLYRSRADRHAALDVVALDKRRARNRAGRRARVQQGMARRGKR